MHLRFRELPSRVNRQRLAATGTSGALSRLLCDISRWQDFTKGPMIGDFAVAKPLTALNWQHR